MLACKLHHILGSQLQQIRLEVFSLDYFLIFNTRENNYEKFMKDEFVKNIPFNPTSVKRTNEPFDKTKVTNEQRILKVLGCMIANSEREKCQQLGSLTNARF